MDEQAHEQNGLLRRVFKGILLKDHHDEEHNNQMTVASNDINLLDIINDSVPSSVLPIEGYKNYFQLITPKSDLSHSSITVEVTKKCIKFNESACQLISIKNISSIIEYEKNKNEAKYQQLLLGSVSHEMLTPLNAIINLSTILKKKYDKHAALTSDQERRSSVVSLKSLYQAVSDSSSIMRIINNSAILMKYLV